VRLRITVKANAVDEAENKIHDVETKLRSKIDKLIYTSDEEELEDVVGKLLSERKLTIAIAESCTGGLIADRITNVSGSSEYFERGIIAYSNKSKVEELGVPLELISQHGAVSREVAEAMALGIRTRSKTEYRYCYHRYCWPDWRIARKTYRTCLDWIFR